MWLVGRSLFDSLGRAVIVTDQYVEGSSAPVMGTRTLYDDQGATVGTERLDGVVIDLVGGATVLVSAGAVVSASATIYDEKGRVDESVSATGQISNFEYDKLNRRTAVIEHPVTIDGEVVQHRVETQYDEYGRTALERANVRQFADGTIDASAARETHFEHDEFGNMLKSIFADATFTTAQFDAQNRKIGETDQVGNTTDFEFDTAGRLSAIELPAVPDPNNGNQLTSPRYEYQYDAQGNTTEIVDPLGHTTSFTVDARGLQLTRKLPLGQGGSGFVEEFQYDDRGRRTLHVSFEGVVTQAIYDDGANAAGRLIEKRFFDNLTSYNGGLGTPTDRVLYVYDAFGRAVRSTQIAGAQQRVVDTAYDTQGRVTSVTSPEGIVNYEYDPVSGLETRVWTGTNSSAPTSDVRYAYDPLGRMDLVTVQARNGVVLEPAQYEVTDYVYDLLGNVDQVRLPDSVISDRAVDRHVARRLRRWLCKKHRVPGRGTARYPDAYLHQLGLVRLSTRTHSLPWAKA